jgi:hypothetical protein
MASDPVVSFLREKQGTLGGMPGYGTLTTACEVTGITLGKWLQVDNQSIVLQIAGLSEDTCRTLLAHINIEARRRSERAFFFKAAGC